ESIEDNSLKEAQLIIHKASIIHSSDVEEKKALVNTNIVEALLHTSKFDSPIEILEPLLSSSSHHKPYKKDTRK
ncbi:hypothetical protein PanWU01x14_150500, partial [Parasponia andersonii]